MIGRDARTMRLVLPASLTCALLSCQGKTLQAYPDELGGIGVVLKVSSEGHTVTSVVADGPAAVAGIEVGDRIVSVDGVPSAGRSLASVVEALRGRAGTEVIVKTSGRRGEITMTLKRRVLARKGPPEYHAN